MTFNVGTIEGGGTHAGWKVQKPVSLAWACKCGPQPRYLVNCTECKETRP